MVLITTECMNSQILIFHLDALAIFERCDMASQIINATQAMTVNILYVLRI